MLNMFTSFCLICIMILQWVAPLISRSLKCSLYYQANSFQHSCTALPSVHTTSQTEGSFVSTWSIFSECTRVWDTVIIIQRGFHFSVYNLKMKDIKPSVLEGAKQRMGDWDCYSSVIIKLKYFSLIFNEYA